MAKHNDTGRWGEEVACNHLVAKGYAITERNWKPGRYELDLVAQRGQRIIFVEVKTRSTDDVDFMSAVDARKQRRIAASANAYIQMNRIDLEPQFDVIGVVGTPDSYSVEHIEDAFWPALKTYR